MALTYTTHTNLAVTVWNDGSITVNGKTLENASASFSKTEPRHHSCFERTDNPQRNHYILIFIPNQSTPYIQEQIQSIEELPH